MVGDFTEESRRTWETKNIINQMNNAKKDKQQNGAAQAENLHSDAVPRLGHFLNHSHWLEGLKLLKYQLERKKENRHFLTLEMCYYA